jgi:hypothetical protein
MKKLFFTLLFLISISVYSQDQPQEPDFIGEAFIIKKDNSTIPLDKQTIEIKTSGGVSVALITVAKRKKKIKVTGCCSNAIYDAGNEIKLVVRAVDNETDPMSIVNIFKFKRKKKKREAVIASYGIWSSSTNDLERLNFTAKKYGEKSYLLTINQFEKNTEYGIIITNPNALDEKNIIVSTFATK